MTAAVARTRKLGGSLMVTIPREVVEAEGLVEDQLITLEVSKMKISGFGMAKGIGPFRKEDKFVTQLEKMGML